MLRLAKLATAACALAAMTAAFPMTAASAKEAGDLMVRLRGIYVTPDEDSGLTVGATAITGEATVDDQFVPELDFTYFFTDNLAAELILATTPHDIGAVGTPLGDADLGDVWLLPPTLTVQYHFNPEGQVSPYVGAGINYTIFYSEDPGAAVDIDYEDSFGWALQAGVDVALQGNWYLNLDVKKLWLNTDATITFGTTPATVVNADVDIDPWIIGAGIGYRF